MVVQHAAQGGAAVIRPLLELFQHFLRRYR